MTTRTIRVRIQVTLRLNLCPYCCAFATASALSLEHFPKDIVIIPINRRQFNASPVAGGGYSDVWRCDWIDNGKKRKVGNLLSTTMSV
jgi:hypothetical protein